MESDQYTASEEVLNALRHHRGRHKSETESRFRDGRCSTPCGITEVGTSKRCRFAAWRDVLNALRHHRGRHPTGVTAQADGQDVLNALRHHRGRHSTRPRRETATRCAQRLAASQRSALSRHRFLSFSLRCAQRLAASQRSAPTTAESEIYGRAVLNALRHHRGRHLGLEPFDHRGELCSTPCGITEVGTSSRSTRLAELRRCSTPCGITEVGTLAHQGQGE